MHAHACAVWCNFHADSLAHDTMVNTYCCYLAATHKATPPDPCHRPAGYYASRVDYNRRIPENEPTRDNSRKKLQPIKLNRNLRDEEQQQEIDSAGKYVQRSETVRKWTPLFDKEQSPSHYSSCRPPATRQEKQLRNLIRFSLVLF